MISSLFALQAKLIDKRLALAILVKVTTKIGLVETQEEQLKISGMFDAYRAAYGQKSNTGEADDDLNLDEIFSQLEKLEKVFNISRIDDGFRFNQELQELTAEFQHFYI